MSSTITITVLVENSVSRPVLMAEHGLAFLIDMASRCILFDTGQSRLLTTNARELGIDLDAVDTVVLSHGHYDHCGGLADALANAVGEVTVCAHPNAFQPKYRRTESAVRDIGIPKSSLDALRRRDGCLRMVTVPTEISPGVFVTGEIPRLHPEEQTDEGFRRDAEGQQVDPLSDDQALFLRTPVGTVVLLGCAHAGVINTLDYIHHLIGGQPFHAILGGMHLRSASNERIAWTMVSLRRFPFERFYPAHCTGAKAVAALWAAFPDRCFPCGVGTTINI